MRQTPIILHHQNGHIFQRKDACQHKAILIMMNTDELLDRSFEYLEGPNKDIHQAIALFEQLAHNGNMIAQFALGEIYWNGDDTIEQNNELAIYWYSLAGENGHPLVQLWLGNNYCIGIRTAPDAEKAVYWYAKAAANNVVLAQYHLGICYYTGWGVERDEKCAFSWIKKAAAQNFLDAELFVSEAYKSGIGVPADYNRYRQLSDAILERYEPLAFTMTDVAVSLSKALLAGNGVEKNPALAIRILSSKQMEDNIESMLLLADCYEKGIGVKKNVKTAFQILKRLSDKSDIARNKTKLFLIKYNLED